MSKILITSDIHYDSYPNRTPSAGYRLSQSYQVTDNLLKIGAREGADYLFVLGDILEKEDRDSEVHGVVKECLHRLSKGFKGGCFYILGNHDMKPKSLAPEGREEDLKSSYLHLYMPPEFKYMDRQVLEIDGVTFGFRNYSKSPTLDLSFIKESGFSKIDVLCGHSSQSYQADPPRFQVQDYDDSLVGLALFGHIHQSVCYGKKVSVGVPQRCKISDDSPRVVIYDTILKTWCYVDADPSGKLMDLRETTTADEDYFDPVANIYYISKKAPTGNDTLLKAITSTGYDKIFEAELQGRGLLEIHKAVKDSTPSENLERLDLDFTITSLKVHNWRSIKDLDIKFIKEGKYLVSGHNGAGKSSLYSALFYALSGKCQGQPRDNIRFGEKEMSSEVELSYRGNNYKIIRGTSKLEIYKNGGLLELGNKNQTKDGILQELPFLEAKDLLYYNEGNQRILGQSSSSDTTKLQILYKILGLSEIDAYNSVAQGIYKKLSREFDDLHEKYLISEATLTEKGNYLKVLENQYSGIEEWDPEKRILEKKETLRVYQELYQKKQKYDRQLQENTRITSEIEKTKGSIEELRVRLSLLPNPESTRKRMEDVLRELEFKKTQLKALLNSQTQISQMMARREFILQEGKKIKEDLEALEEEATKPVFCRVYGISCPAVTEEMKRASLETRKKELEEKRTQKLSEYYQITQELESRKATSPEVIQELTTEVSSSQSTLSELSRSLQEYTQVTDKLNDRERYLKSLKVSENTLVAPDLPVDLLSRISNLTSEISTLEGYQRLKEGYKKAEEEHQKLKDLHSNASKTLQGYQEYISLTKPSGVVYTKIFEIIMSSFSDNHVRYEVNITKRGESRYINILAYLKKGKEEVSYQGASQGEKCMMDIHFLSNLKVRFGVLILDEFLGNLDSDNHDEALKKMQSLETNLLFVTSHRENLITFPNQIEATMVGENETKYVVG